MPDYDWGPMTHGTSGPGSPRVLGFYDPESSSWKTLPPTSGEVSTLSAQTLPVWGIASRGELRELPTSERLTPGVGSSSSRLLKTPNANLATNGGSQHPDKRKAGGHGPTLADETEWLLPSPKASDAHRGGMDPHELKRNSPNLSSLGMLLPTPTARDWKSGTGSTATNSRPLNEVCAKLFPTPTAQSYGSNQGGAAGRAGPVRPSLDTLARSGFQTPDDGAPSPKRWHDGNPFAS